MTSPSCDALVHYLSLARLASPESAAQICVQATEDANLFVFGELLATPSIQALQSSASCEKYYQLLRLFAHGTVEDYHHNRALFPPLSPAQLRKLQTLTLVSLAHAHSALPYAQLRDALRVRTLRQLEDVVIDGVYAGLLRARMDQHAGSVQLWAVDGRDVVIPDGIAPMVRSLDAFLRRARQLVAEIDHKIELIAADTSRAKEHKQRAAAELHALRSQLRAEGARDAKMGGRLRNKSGDAAAAAAATAAAAAAAAAGREDTGPFYRRDTRSMRARRWRSSDSEA